MKAHAASERRRTAGVRGSRLMAAMLRTAVLPLGLALAAAAEVRLLPSSGGNPAALSLPGFVTFVGQAAAGGGVRFGYVKHGLERRFSGVDLPVGHGDSDLPTMVLTCRAASAGGEVRLAVVMFDPAGQAWWAWSAPLSESTATQDIRIGLRAARCAAFNPDAGAFGGWPTVERIWLGLAVEGASTGTVDVHAVVLTDEPFRPAAPQSILSLHRADWHISHDAAARCDLAVHADGEGGETMRFDFAFPGGRHMYAIPSLRVPAVEVDAYSGLRLVYRARLPRGIAGVLVLLQERELA